jgi:hypothetical protein
MQNKCDNDFDATDAQFVLKMKDQILVKRIFITIESVIGKFLC